MPDGTTGPAYTRFVAAELANVSTARSMRHVMQPGWVMRSLVSTALDQAQTNILNEFGPDLRRIPVRIWHRVRPQ
ncbi:MAG TPA: hypothetical protein VKU19_41285 [Bryobacteraceae bacterium]|nr:hypothetical protein [Bryobacteraceae bacterium]